MAIEKTIGGDRLGSGKKMKAYLKEYERSTHNLSEKFASSMASGILYPAMCKLALRGDVFDIDIAADARTIPTEGPLFGSYKMQVDVFQCPIRLYQSLLHNNPLALGLNAAQVKFPTVTIETKSHINEEEAGKFNESCLMKYLGFSGLGHSANLQAENTIGRVLNAVPVLSYYDIFKNYYANKQEESAYVITGASKTETIGTTAKWEAYTFNYPYGKKDYDADLQIQSVQVHNNVICKFTFNNLDAIMQDNELSTEPFIHIDAVGDSSQHSLIDITYTLDDLKRISNHTNGLTSQTISVMFATDEIIVQLTNIYTTEGDVTYTIEPYSITKTIEGTNSLVLQPFELENIDDMRYDILSSHTLGTAYNITEQNAYLPYSTVVDTDWDNVMMNKQPMNGLVLKTYQNDLFNNWLNTDWIEGENGINELSKVAIVDGAFSMDSLNFSSKLYNMLNRVAISGGTYEDYQDVVWEEVKHRQIESPIFLGGMSQEIMFDEVIQTAPAEGKTLGTLGGRGRLVNQSRKGGKIHVKVDEASFIIAIVSLTPRIFQTQGNEFYFTDVLSLDDLHKPAMDGIGYQDLIGERMAYFDTTITPNTTTVVHRSKVGKLPAWIEYMTSYDRAYGDFAKEDGKAFMILSRNYEMDETTHGIKDATTYIDPEKYNYPFAYKELSAQNFWVEIAFNIKARRKMSARLIPNV